MTEKEIEQEAELVKREILDKCPDCKDTGILPHDACNNCRRHFNRFVEFKFGGVDRRYWDLTIDLWCSDKATKDIVANYIADMKQNLKTGRGLIFFKSQSSNACRVLLDNSQKIDYKPALILVLRAVSEKGRNIRYITAAGYKDLANKCYKVNRQNKDESEIYGSMKSAHFLALSGLDDEFRGNSYMQGELVELLVQRRFDNHPTIITSDLGQPEFIQAYGQNIYDLIMAIDIDDYRKKQCLGRLMPMSLR